MSTQGMATRRIVAATFAGHFAAAFAALGMPPFYDRILRDALRSDAAYLAGWFFVIPTLLAALSNPWWGALADRFGKRRLLLRAHLGLAASFALTSLAGNVWQFGAALALQGVLGGTFAASNAYLAVLPLASALLIWWLPSSEAPPASSAPRSQAASEAKACDEAVSPCLVSLSLLYGLQFAFIFATVITFPYFVSYAEHRLVNLPTAAPGLLFGLPHLVYLFCAFPMSRRLGRDHLLGTLAASQVLLIVALLAQAWSHDLVALMAWRIVMGVAMTACYIALHGLVAAITHAGNAGRRFGALEGSTKWGAVAAGLVAGIAATHWGLHAAFLIGAATLGVTTIPLFFLMSRSSRGAFKQPARTTDGPCSQPPTDLGGVHVNSRIAS